MEHFESELDDSVGTGWVRPRAARLWVRSAKAGRLRVRLLDSNGQLLDEGTFDPPTDEALDGTATFRWPDDVDGATTALEPAHTYDYEVFREPDALLGRGRLLTPPLGWDDCPERFAIAVASCHQPFGDDGSSSTKARRLVEKVHEVLDSHDVKAVVLCGDQVYNDQPAALSLFDDEYFAQVAPPGRSSILECTREEVRALVQDRYRAFWGLDGFQRLQSRWACYPIPDDHDLVDNFGSAPEHASETWRAFREGALDACHDYQTSRVLGRHGDRPESLHHSFAWGPLRVFTMDLRSEKTSDGEVCSIYSDHQLAEVERFLHGNEDAGLLALVLSVPIAHIPEWLSAIGKPLEGEGGDLADRWGQPAARRSRDRLMALLHEHRERRPWQPLVLLGGDVHMGAVSELRWADGAASIHQLISSPLTNDEAAVFQHGSALAHEALQTIDGEGYPRCDVRLLPGTAALERNPVPALNVGIVEVSVREGRCFFRLQLLALNDEGEPVLVYESAELPGPMGGGPEARGDYSD